jgi:hypothetical protein
VEIKLSELQRTNAIDFNEIHFALQHCNYWKCFFVVDARQNATQDKLFLNAEIKQFSFYKNVLILFI